jgi:hypothetical protein
VEREKEREREKGREREREREREFLSWVPSYVKLGLGSLGLTLKPMECGGGEG